MYRISGIFRQLLTLSVRQGTFSETGNVCENFLRYTYTFAMEIFANSLPIRKFPSNENYPMYGITNTMYSLLTVIIYKQRLHPVGTWRIIIYCIFNISGSIYQRPPFQNSRAIVQTIPVPHSGSSLSTNFVRSVFVVSHLCNAKLTSQRLSGPINYLQPYPCMMYCCLGLPSVYRYQVYLLRQSKAK